MATAAATPLSATMNVAPPRPCQAVAQESHAAAYKYAPMRQRWCPRSRLSLNATLGLVMCVTWLASGVPQAMAEGDLVHRLYQLDRTGKFADRIELSASDVPSEVTKRLDKVGLKWPLLSGLLQRAVLWDHGLVFVGPKKLVQVYTGCSKTMSDLVFSMSLVSSITKNESKCTIDRCGTHNHFLMPGCPTDVIAPYTRCAIKPSPDAAYSAGVYWAEDDQSFEVPNTIVRVHSRPNSSRDTLYAIHLTTDDFIDQSSCKPTNNFIVPCQEKKETDIDFCVPALGSTVDAWLRIVAMPPESSFSTTSVVLLGTLVLICVGLSIVLWRMHRTRLHGKVQRLSNLNDSLLGTHRNLMSADDQTNIHNSMPVDYFHSAMNHHSSNGSDDTASNNELLLKSESLRRFVSDPVIVTKRMAFSQINFLRMLTKGGNGEVWLGQFESRYVAMKCLLPSKRADVPSVEGFAEEIRLAATLEHPRIVSFCGVAWQSLSNLCIVTEYMEKGDLETVLAEPMAQSLQWGREKILMAIDIADALVYLHSLAPLVIHRDLKSKNVLIDNQLRAKLSDFGLSRESAMDETMTNGVGTILWSAPEVLEGKRYDEKADIFSLGVVLSEIDTCALPYGFNAEGNRNKMKSMQIVHLVAEGKLLPSSSDSCPPAIKALVHSCVNLDPARRPSAMQVVYTLRSKILPELRKELELQESGELADMPTMPAPSDDLSPKVARRQSYEMTEDS